MRLSHNSEFGSECSKPDMCLLPPSLSRRRPAAAAAAATVLVLLAASPASIRAFSAGPYPPLSSLPFGRRLSATVLSSSSPFGGGTASGGGDRDAERPPPSRPIEILGTGPSAPVRPGVVLIAPSHEASHFLMKAAVFIYAIGLDDLGEMVVRGVIVDHPTAFTVGEMAGEGSVLGGAGLSDNILFRGGDTGSDSVMMLHGCGGDAGAVGGCGPAIGYEDYEFDSGIYEGGLRSAAEAVEDGTADSARFKFFFNYVQFSERQLEEMLDEVDSEGDAWVSISASPELILDSDLDRGEMWKYVRNRISQKKRGT